MKVLLFVGYGTPSGCKTINDLLSEKTFPLNRVDNDVINHIEQNAEEKKADETKSIYELCEESKSKIIKLNNLYFCFGHRKGSGCTMQIVNVDVSRPWKIEEYDGAEYIQYLDYKVINQDINYCNFVN